MSSAPLLIDSLDFAPLIALKKAKEWDRIGDILAQSARRLEQGGASAVMICSNSMHKIFDQVEDAVDVPVLHIADCVGASMKEANASDAALLGTRFVTTENFYRRRLVTHGVNLSPPDLNIVEEVDGIIYSELMRGKATRDAERSLRTIITRKEQEGAQSIVLACTELEMIVDVDANVLPIFDSTTIHCKAAADWILG